jgi:protein TonB
MTALDLHFPERRGIARWALSGAAIVTGHAIVIAALVVWYTRMPLETNVLPAIAITLADPTSGQAPANEMAIGIPQREQEYQPPEPPREEKPVDQPVEKLMPPPPQPAEVTLPKPVEHVEEQKKQIEYRPKQEARAAAPKNEALKQSSVAASQAYGALVSGHLRRFVDRRVAERYGKGNVVVSFTLNREGKVLASRVIASSGNAALDREALAVVSRANPFPPFPAEKTGQQDSWTWPVHFDQER